MSLSPPHSERIKLPHQPRPPKHWPADCIEAPTYEAEPHRQFKCPRCGSVHYVARDEMGPEFSGLSCDGSITVQVLAEPRE